jgi:hypothetical protein
MKKSSQRPSSKKSRKHEALRARRQKARNLRFEACEERTLLAANLFLQGTAFIDMNGNNVLDYQAGNPDQYKVGATIELLRGNTLIGQAITDVNGRYIFDDTHNLFPGEQMLPGTYRLREIPPPIYTTNAVEIKSQLSNAVAVAEIDPEYTAFVAQALYPARQGYLLVYICQSQFAAGVGTQHKILVRKIR